MTGDTFSKSSAELSPETLNADDVESFLLHHLAQHTLDEPRFGVRDAHGHVAAQPQHIVLRLDKVHTTPHAVLDQLACLPAAIILD